jgi:hypothetical protein
LAKKGKMIHAVDSDISESARYSLVRRIRRRGKARIAI